MAASDDLAAAATPSRVAGSGSTFAEQLQYESAPGGDGSSERLGAESNEVFAEARQFATLALDVQCSCPDSWPLAVVLYAGAADGELLGLSGWSGWRIAPEWQRVWWTYYGLPAGTARVWAGLAVNGVVAGEGAFDVWVKDVVLVGPNAALAWDIATGPLVSDWPSDETHSSWVVSGLTCRWRTDDLESSWQAAMPLASLEAQEMTDSWQVGALSAGGTP